MTEINEDDRRFLMRMFASLVKISSASSPDAVSKPTSEGETVILRRLENLFRSWGGEPVFYENGYLMVRLPATVGYEDHPAFGFLAHVDTSPDCSGSNISPQIVRNYQGGGIRLKNGLLLSPRESPELLNFIGDDIVTSTGETLLGADDKAGAAVLSGMIRKFLKESLPHGELFFLFTTDEEVGRGMENPPLADFCPQYAFTFDGGTLGEAECECFNAVSATIEIRGKEAHLGQAKGKLINALDVASRIITALPDDEKPESTEGADGYYCPVSLNGSLEKAVLTVLLRDFDEDSMMRRIGFLKDAVRSVEKIFSGAEITLRTVWQYRNMKAYIPSGLVEYLSETMKSVGIEPRFRAVRGGTDGARLSEHGIPCPNIFAGGHLFHSRTEWLSVSSFYASFSLGMALVSRSGFLKSD